MKPTAVFLIAGVSKLARQAGVTITDDDLAVLDAISEQGGVDAHLVMVCEAPATHGRKPTMAEIRAERSRVLHAIEQSGADFVVAFGPVPVAALWNKGGIKATELRMKKHALPDVPLPVHVVNSLEEAALKPGLRNWIVIEILRAVAGETPVQMGEYEIGWEMSNEIAERLLQSGVLPVVEKEKSLSNSGVESEIQKEATYGYYKAAGIKVPMLWGDGSSLADTRSQIQRRREAEGDNGSIYHHEQAALRKAEQEKLSATVRQLSPGEDQKYTLSVCSVDLETYPATDPYAPDARIRMAVISFGLGYAQVVPAGPASELPEWFQGVLSDDRIMKVGSNIRFDVRWLERFGYKVNNFMCTQMIEHLIDENAGVKDLKSLCLRYTHIGDYSVGQRKLVEERAIRDKKGKLIEDGWRHIKDAEMGEYCGADGEAGIGVFIAQSKRIADDGLERPFAVMREYFPAISRLEMAGACVDMAENAALKERYQAELSRLKAEIRGYLGPINPRSPDQLMEALKSHVQDIDLRKFLWKRGDDQDNPYTTEAAVLKREAAKNPAIRALLDFRRRDSLYKFVNGMGKHVTRVNGQDFVFSSLRGDITTTYRHSSSRPNLQNLPRTTEAEAESLNVKRQYVSRFEGGSIREYDQAQLELREAGMIANDRALIRAFAAGEDIHTTLAAMMRGIEPSEVTEDIRQKGKTTNFHVLYGGGPWGLSLRLGCDRQFANRLVQQFDETFVDYRVWEAKQHALARKQLYVESRYGFRRRFAKPLEWNSPAGRSIYRQAGNAPIQGGASVTVNLGIAKVLRLFDAAGLRSVPFLTVHDSLVVDTYPGEESLVDQIVQEGMERPDTEKYGVELTIPLMVECKAGSSWGDLKKVKL